MEKRIMNLIRKEARSGNEVAKELVKWGILKGEEVKRNGSCNEWDYFKFGCLKVHYNTETDKIKILWDVTSWQE